MKNLRSKIFFMDGVAYGVRFLGLALFASYLVGCGSALRDSEDSAKPTSDKSIEGSWVVERLDTKDSCGYQTDGKPFALTLRRENGGLTVTDARATYRGGSNAQGYYWSGQSRGSNFIETYAVDSVRLNGDNFSGWARVAHRGNAQDDIGCVSRYRINANRLAESRPQIPTITAQAVSDQTIRLSWSAGRGNVRKFRVMRRDDNLNDDVLIAWVGSDISEFFDGGLMAGRKYQYRIAAVNNMGLSPYARAEATTLAPPVSAPAAPSEVSAQVDGTQVVLKWKNASDIRTGYRIFRFSESTPKSLIADIPGHLSIYTDVVGNPTAPSVNYVYTLQSYNAKGESVATNPFVVTVNRVEIAPPKPVSNVVTKVWGDGRLIVKWSASDSDGSLFRIERGNDETTFDKVGWVMGYAREYVDEGSDTDVGLSSDTSYVYRVFAVNSKGESSPAIGASVATPNPTAAPTNDMVPAEFASKTVTSAEAYLSWKVPAQWSQLRNIVLERKDNDSTIFEPIAYLAPSDEAFIDNTIVPTTPFAYRLRADNSVGSAPAFSKEVAITTPKGQPVIKSAYAVVKAADPKTMALQWSVEEAGLKFRLFRSDDGGTTYNNIVANSTWLTENSYLDIPGDQVWTPHKKLFYRLYAYRNDDPVNERSDVTTIEGQVPPYTLKINNSSASVITISGVPNAPSVTSCAANDPACAIDFAGETLVTLSKGKAGQWTECLDNTATSCTINLVGDKSVGLNEFFTIDPLPVLPPIFVK